MHERDAKQRAGHARRLFQLWRAGKTYPGIIIPDIGAAAFRTIKENEKQGPRFAPWTPLPDNLLDRAAVGARWWQAQ